MIPAVVPAVENTHVMVAAAAVLENAAPLEGTFSGDNVTGAMDVELHVAVDH